MKSRILPWETQARIQRLLGTLQFTLGVLRAYVPPPTDLTRSVLPSLDKLEEQIVDCLAELESLPVHEVRQTQPMQSVSLPVGHSPLSHGEASDRNPGQSDLRGRDLSLPQDH